MYRITRYDAEGKMVSTLRVATEHETREAVALVTGERVSVATVIRPRLVRKAGDGVLIAERVDR